jgi:hypothetical protein
VCFGNGRFYFVNGFITFFFIYSGRLIVSHTHIPSKDFYFYFENDKWEIAPEQKEELAEFLEKNGLKSPKPIKLPDASFFETQMKMPM